MGQNRRITIFGWWSRAATRLSAPELRRFDTVKFALFYEIPVARPWTRDSELHSRTWWPLDGAKSMSLSQRVSRVPPRIQLHMLYTEST